MALLNRYVKCALIEEDFVKPERGDNYLSSCVFNFQLP